VEASVAKKKREAANAKKAAQALVREEAKRLRRAEMLLDVSHTVAGIETLEEVLETLVEIAARETKSERGTLFLNDPQTGELYSRVAMGTHRREIRLLNNSGIAGAVFSTGEPEIIEDAYEDDRFNHTVDKTTGFTTRNILCVPIRTVKGEIIGVAQMLNKLKDARFTKEDQSVLQAITTQAAITLQSAQYAEDMQRSRMQELEFLDIVADLTSEIDLKELLRKVMSEATRMLNADRSTLFLNDEKTNELWSQVGEGLETTQIRFPNHLGIAGAVFTSSETVNIPHAYADLRFNPAFDKQTGFFTRSILCVPVINKEGKTIGVTQVLNKRGGPFTEEDESRLKAFTAQVSIGLENAKLFADVQAMKNYNESMLESMSNGVITMDEERKIVTCNAAGLRLFNVEPEDILEKQAEEFFVEQNAWLIEKIDRVDETLESANFMDASLKGEEDLSVNLTVLPLFDEEKKKLGTMLMIEDISSEKRVKSTMARYMDPALADQLLGSGEEILGGASTEATILFSDIRSFTTLTEELGAQGTVSLLNEYFTLMVDCITEEEGMLDKFIGDAIMAAFGIPIAHGDDEDRAMRSAISMLTVLQEFNADRLKRDVHPVNIGIGLNTDAVVSGNIGSPKRMDYTVIGDGVNLAARLESACKQYNAKLLISENTYGKLKGTYRIRDVDDVIVKGKTKPVRVYEVMDFHNEESYPNLIDGLNYFKSGRELYHAGEFEKAIKSFKQVLKVNAEDKLAETYIGRCEHLIEEHPGGAWDGVWVMTSK